MVDLSKVKKQVKHEGMKHKNLDSLKLVFWRQGALNELFFQTLQNFICSFNEDLNKAQSNFYVQVACEYKYTVTLFFTLLLVWVCYQR